MSDELRTEFPEIGFGHDLPVTTDSVNLLTQLFDLSDDMATKLDIEFYQDARDALMKALAE
jgi:hypothetical protein